MESMIGTKAIAAVGVAIAIFFVVIVGIVTIDATDTAVDGGMDTFTVTDVTVNRDCTMDDDLDDESVIVEYNDGTGYTTLTETTDYTISGDTVTVLASAMT